MPSSRPSCTPAVPPPPVSGAVVGYPEVGGTVDGGTLDVTVDRVGAGLWLDACADVGDADAVGRLVAGRVVVVVLPADGLLLAEA